MSSTANRWVPFQCPACSGLFRLRKSQVGKTGLCPTCRVVVEVSVSADALVAGTEVARNSAPKVGSLLDRIALAKQMTPEELARQEEANKERKRHYAGVHADTIGWEENDVVSAAKGMPWGLLGMGLIGLTLLVGGTAYYFKEVDTEGGAGESSVLGDAASQDFLKTVLNKDFADGYLDENGVDQTVAAVDLFNTHDTDKVEEVVKAFLNAGTIEERVGYCRDPERVRPLMESFYGGEEIEVEGFEGLKKSEITYRDSFLTGLVQTADFLTSPIAVERKGEGADSIYLVDWESWVGYCDVSAEEMRSQKPTRPMRMRVLISPENYYNYGFSDDEEWQSYRLSLRNSEYTFLAYVKRGSELNGKFVDVKDAYQGVPYLIEVVYPPKAKAEDQVEIVKVIGHGWIFDEMLIDDE